MKKMIKEVKNMKKTIAIILSIVCLFSVFAISASADIGDDISNLQSTIEGNTFIYCVVYKKEPLSNVKVMYFPGPNLKFDAPGYLKVTNDTPIAIDHDFVCWKDKDGKQYYAGDDFYVDGECELYPVWKEKTDNYPHFFRVIKAATETFLRMFQKAFGIFKVIDDFNKDYNATSTDPANSGDATTTTEPPLESVAA